MFRVPVVNYNQEPMMPTTILRARRWIDSGRATGFWKKGIFCVRINKPEFVVQEIAVGIDPGSKKEGFTVKSAEHTYVNMQANAVTWVKQAVEQRRNVRKARRYRKCPYRQPRYNRSCLKKNRIPPSTKSRWQWKLRILTWLKKLFPVSHVVVEDVKAKMLGKKWWDQSFSPLQMGKNWFYEQISNLTLKQGWETKELRDQLGLKKLKNKLSNDFHSHCVDSWVLANSVVGGDITDNKKVIYIRPLRFHRRQLHMFCPSKGGIRKRYGGTISLGFKRGSLIKHPKYGICYIGGTNDGRISLHNMSGNRVCKTAKVEDCKFLCYASFIIEG